MAPDNKSEQERRRFLRLEMPTDARAVDAEGRLIGRVEKVSGGGMQIRISPEAAHRNFAVGSQFEIRIVEDGENEQSFEVEVRDRAADILGVSFPGKPS